MNKFQEILAVPAITRTARNPDNSLKQNANGSFETFTVPARNVVLDITIDTKKLAEYLCWKAITNESRMATEAGGAVVVQYVGDQQP